MRNILLILLIVTNICLIVFTIKSIQSSNEFEARLNKLQRQIENPEVKIIPVN
jgi:hypothetical protein